MIAKSKLAIKIQSASHKFLQRKKQHVQHRALKEAKRIQRTVRNSKNSELLRVRRVHFVNKMTIEQKVLAFPVKRHEVPVEDSYTQKVA